MDPICPLLTLNGNPRAVSASPDPAHRCSAGGDLTTIEREFQARFCLGGRYLSCERFAAHRTQDVCATCHNLMDPIGLGLENYDGAGRYRTTENGEEIDASGEVMQSDIPGAFKGPVELAQKLGRAREGALVTEVVPTSPAARSGIRAGDLILAFGPTAIRRANDLPRLTARAPAGSEVDVTFARDGREQTVKVRLGDLPERPRR